ncbi:MAG: dihydropteroate synthase [Burkholderiales bacterium]|nr:dihydropteroate synthase [Burkholderiales bacterium]
MISIPDRRLCVGRFALALDRPLIMGVLNVTSDSFSDGGRFLDAAQAIEHGRRMVEEGADILDIGGESTRPGAAESSVQEEADRVLPVIEALRTMDVPISVDTRKPQLMYQALAAGADMINDIEALRAPGAMSAVAASRCALCLMHMQGDPKTMQQAPQYQDVLAEVRSFLRERVSACETAGIARDRLVVDPGFGFGKTLQHNLVLLRGLPQLSADGIPVVAGLSRKSMLGRITGRGVDERLAGSIAAAMLAVDRGASIVRVHDVAATRDALLVREAVLNRDDRA